MKYHRDYSVKIETETEYQSLYKWCLKEFTNDDTQVGRDLIPWVYSLYFDVTDLRHNFTVSNDNLENLNEDSQDSKTCTKNVIVARMKPSKKNDVFTSYSMVGTKRNIQEIELKIQVSEKTYCTSWGMLKSTFDDDFHEETVEDFLTFNLYLPPKEFTEIIDMINSGISNKALFIVSGVKGFYSDWSPDITTNYIKILTRSRDEQELKLHDGADVNPPRLGEVSDFTFQLAKELNLESKDPDQIKLENYNWAKQRANAVVKRFCKDEDEHGNYTFNENREKRLTRTNKYKILKEIYFETHKYSLEKNLTDEKLEELIDEIDNVIFRIKHALDSSEFDDNQSIEEKTKYFERSWQLWQYPEIDIMKIYKGEKSIPDIDVDEIKYSLTEYLKLPVRNKNIDRLLVDVLITNEITQFSTEMLYNKDYPDHLKSPLLISHPLWRFIKAQAINFTVISLIPIMTILLVIYLFDIKQAWPFFVSFGFFIIGILFFIYNCFKLPNFWLTESRNKQKTIELLDEMLIVSKEMRNSSIISAKHIIKRLEKTSDKRAIWPSEIFPLLDDIVARGGVF